MATGSIEAFSPQPRSPEEFVTGHKSPAFSENTRLHRNNNHSMTSLPTSAQTRRYFSGVAEYLAGRQGTLDILEDHVDMSGASCIGRGCVGDVFLASTKAFKQPVAVKVIPLRGPGHEETESRARKEVAALRDLGEPAHPHVVRLLGVLAAPRQLAQVDKAPPYVCLVMEYVADARPLSQYIYSARGLADTRAFAAKVLAQLARALSFIHQKGYVHRDVWSENVLLTTRGVAVLVDFGSAERHDIAYTARNKLNIPYMSPNAYSGGKQAPVDDCWALGLLLSEMITGCFVRNRLGGKTSLPVHAYPGVVPEIVQDSLMKGGPELGQLVDELLAEGPSSMEDVAMRAEMCIQEPPSGSIRVQLTQLKSQASVPTPGTGVKRSTSPRSPPLGMRMEPSRRNSYSRKDGIVGASVQTALDDMSRKYRPLPVVVPQLTSAPLQPQYKPGDRVRYLARSNGVWYPGVVLGRVAPNRGWSLLLDCGERKDVDDPDAWRIEREGND